MRPIDADALIEKYGSWYVEEGTESGFIGTLINLLATEPTIQPVATDINVGDTISKFIDGLEEIFADLRERHVDDSVCGLCEYDGAYMGQSGDWCNECPGFERDDCFKLSDKTRKEWTEEIIKALPTVQSEPHWIPVSEKLPELDEDGYSKKVLVSFDLSTVIEIMEYRVTDGVGKWFIGDSEDSPEDIGLHATAWMPLPERYISPADAETAQGGLESAT